MTRSLHVPGEASEGLRVVQAALTESVVAAYLFGSAVVGGLRTSSDVDVLVIVDRAVPEPARRRVVEGLLRVSGRAGRDGGRRPLELTVVCRSDVVPWRYPPLRQLQYGEWLRAAFEAGHGPDPSADPDLAIVLSHVLGHGVPLLGPPVSEILDAVPAADLRRAMRDALPGLLEGIRGDERNVLLTLARMWRTAAEGDIVPKDVAAAWAVDRLDVGTAALLDVARRGYVGEEEDSWSEQVAGVRTLVATLRRSVEACLRDEA